MKRVASFILLSLFIISFVSAVGVNIELDKTEFNQGELLQAEISGAFLENLKSENIAIYEDGEVHSVPLASSDLLKLENKYLYYAILPNKVGNYSFKIEDIEYYFGQDIIDNTTEKEIKIVSSLDPYISPSKGFIVATDDFKIKVKSLNGIQEITASFDANGEEVTKEVGYNSEKTFSFTIQGITEYTESTLTIGKIEIPVFVYPPASPPGGFINNTELEEQIESYTNQTQEEPEVEVLPLEEATTEQIQTCADINGKLCKKSEICVGPTSFAQDILCCLGECEEKKSGTGWIFGIIIIVALGIASYFLYNKYKKTKQKPKDEQVRRIEKFKQRMNLPNLQPEVEVKRSLDRV